MVTELQYYKQKNKCMRILFFSLIFLTMLSPLLAQGTERSSKYFLETRFVQRLTWIGDGYALRYEVIIEKTGEKDTEETSGKIARVLQEFTEGSYIDVSLTPGNYRYRVIPYDFFNKPGNGSDWIFFEVRAALRPEIYGFSPAVFYLSENNKELILTVNGKNITSDAEIFIHGLDPLEISINPKKLEIDSNGSQAALLFDTNKLLPGLYVIVVRNSGGIETIKGEFIVSNQNSSETRPVSETTEISTQQKTLSFYLAPAWAPIIPISGGIEQMYGNELQPIGMGLRFGVTYNMLKAETLKPGMEFMTTLHINNKDFGTYNTQTFVMTINLNLFLQKWLARSFAVALRGGVGFGIQTSSYDGNEQEDLYLTGGNAPHINTGATLLWSPSKFIFIEAGADYTFLLSAQNRSSYLTPCVSIGWRY